ncbi:hypothetical protein MKZ02_09990 [Pseudobacillus sp. FSL P4-0506]|uniref:hypothetical protein n=1 Tax=unclassified Pseudobacillus TaxID=2619284 RepID=UPI0030F4B765
MIAFVTYLKAAIVSLLVAAVILFANMIISYSMHALFNTGKREWLSTGTGIIFLLIFLSSFLYQIQKQQKGS